MASHLNPAHLPHLSPTPPQQLRRNGAGVSPILTGNPGGRRRVMKSRSLAKSALLTAMRSMMGATCSHRDRGCSSHSHSLALNLCPGSQGVRGMAEAVSSQHLLEPMAFPAHPTSSTSRGPHFCVLVVSSMGRPMSRLPSSKLGLKYSSAVMAVGLAWLRV